MTPMWLKSELHAVTEIEEDSMSNVDDLIERARALTSERLQERTMREALQRGATVSSSGFFGSAIEMFCGKPDRELIEKSRLVVQGDTARIELFDGESWREIWRSDTSEAKALAPEAPAEQPSAPEPLPGQIVLQDGRFRVWGK